MAISMTATLRNARGDQITTAIGTGAKLKIYDGATLLATWTWGGATNMFDAAAAGVLAMNAPSATTVNAADSGTASSAKITTSADAEILTGLTVGTSGANIIIDNTTITANDPIVLDYETSAITEGNA